LVAQLYEQAPVATVQVAFWPVAAAQSVLVQQYDVGTQVVLPAQVLYPVAQAYEQAPLLPQVATCPAAVVQSEATQQLAFEMQALLQGFWPVVQL
jgi:hypothetical protein